jgi:predicted nucleotidyltransferase
LENAIPFDAKHFKNRERLAKMPTALELTQEERQKYIDSASRRAAMPGMSEKERKNREKMLMRVRETAQALKAQFGVRRVVLFGSIAQTHWSSAKSDVDLTVEGLKRDAYWQAWKTAEDRIGDRPVDLVGVELATESLKTTTERYGIEI